MSELRDIEVTITLGLALKPDSYGLDDDCDDDELAENVKAELETSDVGDFLDLAKSTEFKVRVVG